MADSLMWKASSAGKSMSPPSALDIETLRRSIAQHTGLPRVYLGADKRFELPPCVSAKGRFHGEPAAGFRWRKFTKYAAGEIGRRWWYEGVVALDQDQQVALTVYRRRGGQTIGLALYRFRKRWSFAAVTRKMVVRAGADSPYTVPDSARGADAAMMVLRP